MPSLNLQTYFECEEFGRCAQCKWERVARVVCGDCNGENASSILNFSSGCSCGPSFLPVVFRSQADIRKWEGVVHSRKLLGHVVRIIDNLLRKITLLALHFTGRNRRLTRLGRRQLAVSQHFPLVSLLVFLCYSLTFLKNSADKQLFKPPFQQRRQPSTFHQVSLPRRPQTFPESRP